MRVLSLAVSILVGACSTSLPDSEAQGQGLQGPALAGRAATVPNSGTPGSPGRANTCAISCVEPATLKGAVYPAGACDHSGLPILPEGCTALCRSVAIPSEANSGTAGVPAVPVTPALSACEDELTECVQHADDEHACDDIRAECDALIASSSRGRGL